MTVSEIFLHINRPRILNTIDFLTHYMHVGTSVHLTLVDCAQINVESFPCDSITILFLPVANLGWRQLTLSVRHFSRKWSFILEMNRNMNSGKMTERNDMKLDRLVVASRCQIANDLHYKSTSFFQALGRTYHRRRSKRARGSTGRLDNGVKEAPCTLSPPTLTPVDRNKACCF